MNQPVITLMLEARLHALVDELERTPPHTLDERLLSRLHTQTMRLLRWELPTGEPPK